MFGKPKDDLLEELEKYDKGEKNDIFEDYAKPSNVPLKTQFQKSFTTFRTHYSTCRLMNGEQVIWQGKSKGGPAGAATNIFHRVFGIIWLGFSVVWTLLASMGSFLFAAFGIPFIIIGILLVTNKIDTGAIYIITDKRILINANRSSSVYYSHITDLNYEVLPDGSGNITFSSQNFNSFSGGTIYGIPNVDLVYSQMVEAIEYAQKQ